MANEYRFYKLGAEVINTGDPDVQARIYKFGAEVINTGDPAAPVRFYKLGAEVIRTIAATGGAPSVGSISILW